MKNPFESTGKVKASLSEQKYIASDEIATIVYLAQKLGKPLLTEGPAGVAHPWFLGVQFHPEYRTTVQRPHPLFVDFVAAAVTQAEAAGTYAAPQEPARVRRVRRASARVLAGDGQ